VSSDRIQSEVPEARLFNNTIDLLVSEFEQRNSVAVYLWRNGEPAITTNRLVQWVAPYPNWSVYLYSLLLP